LAEIEAIVSDFGGVLTTPLLSSFMAVQDEIGISPENLGKAMRTVTEEDGENPLYLLERGEMSEVDFLARLGDGLEPLLGHRPQLHRFRETYFEALHPNEPMIELMRELKAGGSRRSRNRGSTR
jgi:putative hydrolase of the HAD superfamily